MKANATGNSTIFLARISTIVSGEPTPRRYRRFAMRVPIYPCDLTHSQGFKSIAKKLKTNWCGTSPITLAFAQETLAKGFGYSSLYDLQEFAKTSKSGQAAPSEADVRMGVLAAIKNAIAFDQKPFTDEGSLINLVNDLPIKSLSAYRFRDQIEHASPQIDSRS
ncbi:hypothetical protein PPS11_03143 [Pseudomonas putida S11]|nr:hypothetical protein PPS11_03143 [Pseudomonas putida S11]